MLDIAERKRGKTREITPPKNSSERLLEIFLVLVDVSDIFNFFLLGEGEGGVRGAGRGGGLIFSENPRREGVYGGGGLAGRERPGGCLRQIGGFWGGGGQIFFFGAEMSTKNQSEAKQYDFGTNLGHSG